jgi:hypothetical protein
MLILDVGPPAGERTRGHLLNLNDREWWVVENQGPCLVHVDDHAGAEMAERNPTRYLVANGSEGWGHFKYQTVKGQKFDAEFVPSGIEPVDRDPTHARGTVQGEYLVQERVRMWKRQNGLPE